MNTTGPYRRMVQQRGREYEVRNATGGGGDRTVPSYPEDPDATLVGVLERRSRPTVETLSSGEEIETELELRALTDGVEIQERDETETPTRLTHPDGPTYEVVARYPEDSGVDVLTLIRT